MYIAKAYYLFESPIKARMLINQIERIFDYDDFTEESKEGVMITEGHINDFSCEDMLDLRNYINIGHYTTSEDYAIKLFLELAKMRNDTDKDQWFITEADKSWVNQRIYAPKGSFELCLVEDRYMGQDKRFANGVIPAHKATPLELCEAFRDGKIRLYL